jgi:hypothetical protein
MSTKMKEVKDIIEHNAEVNLQVLDERIDQFSDKVRHFQ